MVNPTGGSINGVNQWINQWIHLMEKKTIILKPSSKINLGIGLILEDGFRWITNLDGIYIGITLWLIWLGESQIDVRWCQMMIHDDPWWSMTLSCCFMLKKYEKHLVVDEEW